MTVIEKRFGIPRSTLSLWFKDVEMSEKHKTQLKKNSADGWVKARVKAVESHQAKKALRLLQAKQEALETLDKIELSGPVLDLAFAMLYMGEGAKTDTTALASSDPTILRFVLKVLRLNYAITPEMIRCDLHLRMDQDGEKLTDYWAMQLNIPNKQFKYIAYDKRSEGKPTYDHYKGVCVITCHRVAIQRKLIYLYTMFCEKVNMLDEGA